MAGSVLARGGGTGITCSPMGTVVIQLHSAHAEIKLCSRLQNVLAVLVEYLACSALQCFVHWELPFLAFSSCFIFSLSDIWSCYKTKSQNRIAKF